MITTTRALNDPRHESDMEQVSRRGNYDSGEDFVLAKTPSQMVDAISELLDDASKRQRIEEAARRSVERDFGWDQIAHRQTRLYREFL